MNKITKALKSAPQYQFALYSIAFSFAVYFCMFAFRKPFSVAVFEGTVQIPLLPEINYKILLIISQILGYTLSKFLGIKFVSETTAKHRAPMIIACILLAEVALLFFALTPKPYNVILLFLNGIPLGMVWGLVFGYLEGRKLTDLLGPSLCLSFIVGSGAVKSVGSHLLGLGISEQWMPVVTGVLFLPAFLISVYFLNLLPPPSKEDEVCRTKRQPMQTYERILFFKMFAPGLIFSVLAYMTVTAYRDFRDNFSREIWDALGYAESPEIYAVSELPVALGVLIALGLIVFIKGNRNSMIATYLIMFFGAVLIGLSTLGYQMNIVEPATWMIVVGLGLYLAYVPIGCTLYDNILGMTHFMGTAGFMIYVADAFGYLGSIGLLLYKTFAHPNLPWLDFFISLSYATSFLIMLFLIVSLYYFSTHVHDHSKDDDSVPQKSVGGLTP